MVHGINVCTVILISLLITGCGDNTTVLQEDRLEYKVLVHEEVKDAFNSFNESLKLVFIVGPS
jgi:uncharacterized protein YcfL